MPSISPARALGRVQGIDSSIGDLVLRDGRHLALELGGAVMPTPTLTRTIGGSSSISLTLHDHDLAFLEPALLAEKLEAQIDGLWFRYMAAQLDPPQLSLTLEDRDVARLREFGGPVKAYRAKTTRAEFIVALVKQALPRIAITCPQLHKKQPIKTERQGKQAKASAQEERGKGIGDSAKGLSVKEDRATSAQAEIIDRALRVADHLDASTLAKVAMVVALIVESVAGKASKNYFQMTGTTASGSKYSPTVIEEAATGFLKGYLGGEGGAIAYANAHPSAAPHEVAQAVQRSGAGLDSNGAANYGPWDSQAREWVQAGDGEDSGGGSETITTTEPYVFEVHKNEDYWTAIKRLAKEVNWRAFFVAHRFFFIDEIELFRGMVRMAIDRESPGIEKVSFAFNLNRPATEVTISAYANRWTPPPGSVVTLAGYGPASIGFGDAPVKANSKGQLQGLSSNRKAKTGEGRARYLVESIEAPLRDSDVSDLKLITVKLRKPTAPLPEPAPKTKTRTVSTNGAAEGDTAAAGAADPTVARVLGFCEREALAKTPYVWGGFSPAGYDCSGFVSKALNVGGWLSGRLTTVTLASWGEAGEGEFVTVHDKNGTGDPHTEHVCIEVAGRFFQCGGTSGGCGEFHPSPGELAEFHTKRHPHGF